MSALSFALDVDPDDYFVGYFAHSTGMSVSENNHKILKGFGLVLIAVTENKKSNRQFKHNI